MQRIGGSRLPSRPLTYAAVDVPQAHRAALVAHDRTLPAVKLRPGHACRRGGRLGWLLEALRTREGAGNRGLGSAQVGSAPPPRASAGTPLDCGLAAHMASIRSCAHLEELARAVLEH